LRNIGKQSSKRPRRERKPLDRLAKRREARASPNVPPHELCSQALTFALVASADGLANLEALELGMAEVEGLVLSGPMVSGPKGIGPGPGLERGPALPYGVGGIQCEKWLRNFAQGDKWNFCLTAGTLVLANQERP
jgi:hypothetical protein